jgi:hypothetical protein
LPRIHSDFLVEQSTLDLTGVELNPVRRARRLVYLKNAGSGMRNALCSCILRNLCECL